MFTHISIDSGHGVASLSSSSAPSLTHNLSHIQPWCRLQCKQCLLLAEAASLCCTMEATLRTSQSLCQQLISWVCFFGCLTKDAQTVVFSLRSKQRTFWTTLTVSWASLSFFYWFQCAVFQFGTRCDLIPTLLLWCPHGLLHEHMMLLLLWAGERAAVTSPQGSERLRHARQRPYLHPCLN